MAYLIDKNVVSESFKPRPELRVIEWIGGQMANDLFLSSISLGELVRGARRVRDRAKRQRFEHWIDGDLAAQFRGRILPFDHRSAVIWGEIMGDGDRIGRPKPMADAQIAAVALAHDLTLVTRNTEDFAGMGLALLNPWAPT